MLLNTTQYPEQDNAEDFADDLNPYPKNEGDPVEGDWDDEEDDDFDDQMDFEEDLNEIRADDDFGDLDPDDDDHMPNGDEK